MPAKDARSAELQRRAEGVVRRAGRRPSTTRGAAGSSTRCSSRRAGSFRARSSPAATRTRAPTARSARSARASARPTSRAAWRSASSGRSCRRRSRSSSPAASGRYVAGKDLILAVIGEIGVGGGTNCVLEFVGDGAEALLDRRAPRGREHGRRGGRRDGPLPGRRDDRRLPRGAHGHGRGRRSAPIPTRRSPAGSRSTSSALPPLVARPHSPGNVVPLDEAVGTRIDQVYIGNCANGTMTDLRQAAEVLRGRQVHPDCRVIIVPATAADLPGGARRGPARRVRRGRRDGLDADVRRVLRRRHGRAGRRRDGPSRRRTATSAAAWARPRPRSTSPTRRSPPRRPSRARSSIRRRYPEATP